MPTVISQPLFAGQRLQRDEFLRRWEAMPEVKHAELIGGVVYMPSPVSVDHQSHDNLVSGWLAYYAARTPGDAGNDGTWLMLNLGLRSPEHQDFVRAPGSEAQPVVFNLKSNVVTLPPFRRSRGFTVSDLTAPRRRIWWRRT